MRITRTILTGLATMAAAAAMAQFDGPAPLAWRFLYPTTASPSGAPLVDGDRIFTAMGGRVFSIDHATGNLNWRYPQLDPIAGAFRYAPVLAADTIVAVGDNKIVYGIDKANGEHKWDIPIPQAAVGQPVVLAGKVVAFPMADGTIQAIDAEKAEVAWTAPFKVPDGINGNLGVYGQSLLVFSRSQRLMSINFGSQRVEWSRAFDQVPSGAIPVVYGDAIYVNSGSYLVSLNAATGAPRWQVNTDMTLAYAPAVNSDGVLVLNSMGQYVVFTPDRTRLTKEPIALGAGPVANPTGVGSKFVVLTNNGAVNLIDPVKGSILWSYIIRPIEDPAAAGNAPGGNRPGFGGTSGGLGGPPGGFGGQGPANNANPTQIYFVPASGPAVISGTSLIVPAQDGSVLSFDRTTGVDLTPPRVNMIFPNPGDQISGQPPLFLAFRMSDETSGINLSTLKVELDGQELEYKIQKDGLVTVQFSSAGKNRPLANGRRTFIVTVSDWMGNETKRPFVLSIDNALPPIKLPGSDPGPQGPGGGRGPGGD